MSTAASVKAAPSGLNGHRIHPGNMLRAGVAEAVGTFILIYTGTATAGAGALGKATAGSPPDSLAVALAFGLVLAARWSAASDRSPGRTSTARLPSGWR